MHSIVFRVKVYKDKAFSQELRLLRVNTPYYILREPSDEKDGCSIWEATWASYLAQSYHTT